MTFIGLTRCQTNKSLVKASTDYWNNSEKTEAVLLKLKAVHENSDFDTLETELEDVFMAGDA